MNSFLRICALTFVFTSTGLFAQTPAPKPPEPTAPSAPQLSTADKVAIQAIQKIQVDAAKEWQDAEQQKLTVLREWQMSHPGFRVHYNPQAPTDPQNYAVEADAGSSSPSKFSPKPPAPAKTPETPKK